MDPADGFFDVVEFGVVGGKFVFAEVLEEHLPGCVAGGDRGVRHGCAGCGELVELQKSCYQHDNRDQSVLLIYDYLVDAALCEHMKWGSCYLHV